MEKKQASERTAGMSLPLPSSADLRGRQSVRATFKLTERAIEALSICAIHLGIKQKSLFDHLIDDIHALNAIAQAINRTRFSELDRVQKTYVLSRRTLSSLEAVARSLGAPRDALVEYSIQRLLPVIEREKARHRKRKRMLESLGAYMAQGRKLLDQAVDQLGPDDPVTTRLESALTALNAAHESVTDFVEKGDVIEMF